MGVFDNLLDEFEKKEQTHTDTGLPLLAPEKQTAQAGVSPQIPTQTVGEAGAQINVGAGGLTQSPWQRLVDSVKIDALKEVSETMPRRPRGAFGERMGRSLAVGALGTVEGMAGALQWLTEGDFGKGLADEVRKAREQIAVEDPGFIEHLASGLGSMATFFIPGLGVARGAGLVARIAPKVAQLLGAGTMAVLEAATEAGQVYRDKLSGGGSIDDAEKSARMAFFLNLPLLAVTDKLAFFGEHGRALKKILAGAATEGTQEALQEVISSKALGEDVKLKDVLMSGAVGAIIGGGAAGLSNLRKEDLLKAKEAAQKIFRREPWEWSEDPDERREQITEIMANAKQEGREVWGVTLEGQAFKLDDPNMLPMVIGGQVPVIYIYSTTTTMPDIEEERALPAAEEQKLLPGYIEGKGFYMRTPPGEEPLTPGAPTGTPPEPPEAPGGGAKLLPGYIEGQGFYVRPPGAPASVLSNAERIDTIKNLTTFLQNVSAAYDENTLKKQGQLGKLVVPGVKSTQAAQDVGRHFVALMDGVISPQEWQKYVDSLYKSGDAQRKPGVEPLVNLPDIGSLLGKEVPKSETVEKATPDEIVVRHFDTQGGKIVPAPNVRLAPASHAPGSLPVINDFPVQALEIQADVFQHKRGANPRTGETGTFGDITAWDESKAGKLTVFRTLDNRWIIANGHQRYSGATRLGVKTVPIQVYDERDGWTPSRVRVQAAFENISGGTLDPLDVAMVFREIGATKEDLAAVGISLRKAEVDKGFGLSKLNDTIWEDVYRGTFDEELAAIIGNGLPDNHAAQLALYKFIKEKEAAGQPISKNVLSNMIRVGMTAPVGVESTRTLFGEEEIAKSYLFEQGELIEYKQRSLREKKKVFGSAARHRAQLDEAGNIIDPVTNKVIADSAGKYLAILDKAIGMAGTHVSEVLGKYSVMLAQAKSKEERNAIKKEASEALDDAIRQDYKAFFGKEIDDTARTSVSGKKEGSTSGPDVGESGKSGAGSKPGGRRRGALGERRSEEEHGQREYAPEEVAQAITKKTTDINIASKEGDTVPQEDIVSISEGEEEHAVSFDDVREFWYSRTLDQVEADKAAVDDIISDPRNLEQEFEEGEIRYSASGFLINKALHDEVVEFIKKHPDIFPQYMKFLKKRSKTADVDDESKGEFSSADQDKVEDKEEGKGAGAGEGAEGSDVTFKVGDTTITFKRTTPSQKSPERAEKIKKIGETIKQLQELSDQLFALRVQKINISDKEKIEENKERIREISRQIDKLREKEVFLFHREEYEDAIIEHAKTAPFLALNYLVQLGEYSNNKASELFRSEFNKIIQSEEVFADLPQNVTEEIVNDLVSDALAPMFAAKNREEVRNKIYDKALKYWRKEANQKITELDLDYFVKLEYINKIDAAKTRNEIDELLKEASRGLTGKGSPDSSGESKSEEKSEGGRDQVKVLAPEAYAPPALQHLVADITNAIKTNRRDDLPGAFRRLGKALKKDADPLNIGYLYYHLLKKNITQEQYDGYIEPANPTFNDARNIVVNALVQRIDNVSDTDPNKDKIKDILYTELAQATYPGVRSDDAITVGRFIYEFKANNISVHEYTQFVDSFSSNGAIPKTKEFLDFEKQGKALAERKPGIDASEYEITFEVEGETIHFQRSTQPPPEASRVERVRQQEEIDKSIEELKERAEKLWRERRNTRSDKKIETLMMPLPEARNKLFKKLGEKLGYTEDAENIGLVYYYHQKYPDVISKEEYDGFIKTIKETEATKKHNMGRNWVMQAIMKKLAFTSDTDKQNQLYKALSSLFLPGITKDAAVDIGQMIHHLWNFEISQSEFDLYINKILDETFELDLNIVDIRNSLLSYPIYLGHVGVFGDRIDAPENIVRQIREESDVKKNILNTKKAIEKATKVLPDGKAQRFFQELSSFIEKNYFGTIYEIMDKIGSFPSIVIDYKTGRVYGLPYLILAKARNVVDVPVYEINVDAAKTEYEDIIVNRHIDEKQISPKIKEHYSDSEIIIQNESVDSIYRVVKEDIYNQPHDSANPLAQHLQLSDILKVASDIIGGKSIGVPVFTRDPREIQYLVAVLKVAELLGNDSIKVARIETSDYPHYNNFKYGESFIDYAWGIRRVEGEIKKGYRAVVKDLDGRVHKNVFPTLEAAQNFVQKYSSYSKYGVDANEIRRVAREIEEQIEEIDFGPPALRWLIGKVEHNGDGTFTFAGHLPPNALSQIKNYLTSYTPPSIGNAIETIHPALKGMEFTNDMILFRGIAEHTIYAPNGLVIHILPQNKTENKTRVSIYLLQNLKPELQEGVKKFYEYRNPYYHLVERHINDAKYHQAPISDPNLSTIAALYNDLLRGEIPDYMLENQDFKNALEFIETVLPFRIPKWGKKKDKPLEESPYLDEVRRSAQAMKPYRAEDMLKYVNEYDAWIRNYRQGEEPADATGIVEGQLIRDRIERLYLPPLSSKVSFFNKAVLIDIYDFMKRLKEAQLSETEEDLRTAVQIILSPFKNIHEAKKVADMLFGRESLYYTKDGWLISPTMILDALVLIKIFPGFVSKKFSPSYFERGRIDINKHIERTTYNIGDIKNSPSLKPMVDAGYEIVVAFTDNEASKYIEKGYKEHNLLPTVYYKKPGGSKVRDKFVFFAPSEIKRANKSGRRSGAVDKLPKLGTKYVVNTFPTSASILDFGAGIHATQTILLRASGFSRVTAYDFGENVVEGLHDTDALNRNYDVVLANNVLNVQSSPDMMHRTLAAMILAVRPGGSLVANFPAEPRYLNISASDIEAVLRRNFSKVERVGGTPKAPVWHASGRRVTVRESVIRTNFAEKKFQNLAKKYQDAWQKLEDKMIAGASMQELQADMDALEDLYNEVQRAYDYINSDKDRFKIRGIGGGEGEFTLTTPKAKPSALQKQIDEILRFYPELKNKQDEIGMVIKELPEATPDDVAHLIADRELFNRVVRGNLAIEEKKKLAKEGSGVQLSLFGGTLFDRYRKYVGRAIAKAAIGDNKPWAVTEDVLRSIFGPTAKIEKSGNNFVVTLRNKIKITVMPNAHIEFDKEAWGFGYSGDPDAREDASGAILGRFMADEDSATIMLAPGTKLGTLRHETFHAACEFALSRREQKILLRRYGDWETAAFAYEEWEPSNPQIYEPTTIFEKIYNWAKRALKALFPNADDIFQRIRSAKVWSRRFVGPGEILDPVGKEYLRKLKALESLGRNVGSAGRARVNPFEARRGGEGRIIERYSAQRLTQEEQEILNQYDQEVMAPRERVSLWSRISGPESLKMELSNFFNKLKTEIVDKYWPVERKAIEMERAGHKIPKGIHPTHVIGFLRGQIEVAKQALEDTVYHHVWEYHETYGLSLPTDNPPILIGEGLIPRLLAVDRLAEKIGADRPEVMHDLFDRLMIAQRDLELAGEFGNREPDKIEGVRPDQSREVLRILKKKYGAHYKELLGIADDIRDWIDNAILQKLLQAGIISQERYERIKAANQYYIPYKRLFDELEGYTEGEMQGGRGMLKTIKGSERQILDPLKMIIEMAYKANYIYANNLVRLSLAALGQIEGEAGGIRIIKPKIIPGIGGKGAVVSQLPPEPGCISFYRDGKFMWLKLPPDMFHVMKYITPSETGMLLGVASKFAEVLKAGAILSPEFAFVRNPIRDAVQAWIFSSFGFNPIKTYTHILPGLLRGDEKIKDYMREARAGGGFLSTLAQSFVEEKKLDSREIRGERRSWIKFFKNPLGALRYASAYLENLTRLSIYIQAREAGLSHPEAINEMRRSTLDFNRAGAHPVVRYLNMVIPFWNASVQGADKLVTDLTSAPHKAQVWRRIGMMTLFSVLVWALASSDDRYKELPDWERNYFWHIPLGPNMPMLRIPKPFEVGILFGSVPERLIEAYVDRNYKGLNSAVRAAIEATTPELIPTVFRPLVEGWANYSFFQGKPIEDISMQRLPAHLRTKPWTSEFAKWFAKDIGPAFSPLLEISPVKFEHFIRTLSGGIGSNYVLPALNWGLKKAGAFEDIPMPEQKAIQKLWGVQALFAQEPSGYRSKSVSDFFDKYTEIVQADQAWKFLWKSGKTEEARKWLEKHPEAALSSVVRSAMSEINLIRNLSEAVYRDKNLTPAEKRDKLDQIDKAIFDKIKFVKLFMNADIRLPQKQYKTIEEQYEALNKPALDTYNKLKNKLSNILDSREAADFIENEINRAIEVYKPKATSIFGTKTKKKSLQKVYELDLLNIDIGELLESEDDDILKEMKKINNLGSKFLPKIEKPKIF